MGDENGEFRAYMTDTNGETIRLRRKDKEHLSPEGNMVVVNMLLPRIEKKIATFRNNNPDKVLSEKETSRPAQARMDVAFKYVPKKRKGKWAFSKKKERKNYEKKWNKCLHSGD